MSLRFYATVAGIDRATGRSESGRVLITGVNIRDVTDQPSRASFTAMGFTPSVGERVVFTLDDGSSPADSRLFAGSILTVRRGYLVGDPEHQVYACDCVDDTVRLSAKLVIGQFTGTADEVVLELMATYAPEFTTTNVIASLPLLEGGIIFTNQTLVDCLAQIAKRIGGYWYLDYFGDLHFYLTETSDPPDDITSSHATMKNLTIMRDVSQVVTRVFVEGGGANTITEVPAGETILPVEGLTFYSPTGGRVVVGAQRVDYTGLDEGGGGSLVGTGAAPTAAPTGELADGAGVEDGVHQWAYTFVTGSGETIPSPLLTLTVGSVPAPETAPTAGSPTAGSGVTTGDHYYAATFVTAVGETTSSPISNTVSPGPVTTGLINPPASAPTVASPTTGAGGDSNITVKYAVTFTNGAGETTEGPQATDATILGFANPAAPGLSIINVGSGGIANGAYDWVITIQNNLGQETAISAVTGTGAPGGAFDAQLSFSTLPAGATAYNIYRTPAGGGTTYKFVGSTAGTTFTDTVPDASLGAVAPTYNATYEPVNLTNIPIGPAGTTGRKIYATVPSGSQLKLLTTIANNTATTSTDSTPARTARLGANVPTSNTTATTTNYNQVPLTNIPIGPANCTSRKIYRTTAGGSQLKLVATIGNNTATTYTDTTADGSLGADIPVSNTADANRVNLVFGVGPTGTTSRKLYRTVAAGSQLKLLTTVGDNTTTTYTDSTADASLTTNAPTSDTSGLAQPTGQVLAGATSIPVADATLFPSTGWAITSAGQVIRYTGKTGISLTGVPASGSGAIQATIAYNSTIAAAPQLTGIPSGSPSAGSITYTIPKGEPVNLLVQVDDMAAQAALGAMVVDADGNPTDGIVEAYVRDQRLSEAECLARGQAYLALYSTIQTQAKYQCHDIKTRAGVDIVFDVDAPMEFAGTLRIQTVNISFLEVGDAYLPLYAVEASTIRFSFEDLLRRARV